MAKLPGGALAARARPDLTFVMLDVYGLSHSAIGLNGDGRDSSTDVVGCKEKFFGWMQAEMSGACTAGTRLIEQA